MGTINIKTSILRDDISKHNEETFVNEQYIQLIWYYQLIRRDKLITEDGKPIVIRFPGVWNREGGPDFINAHLYINGKLFIGDIEIHLNQSDWYSHQHEKSGAYSNVILHVALWRDKILEDSFGNIPQLILSPYLEKSVIELINDIESESFNNNLMRKGTLLKGYLDKKSGIGEILDSAGDKVFRLKSERFEKLLETLPPDEVLYRGIMIALGYKHNKAQFYELARLLPYAYLKEIAHDYPLEEKRIIKECLLYASGFSNKNPIDIKLNHMNKWCWRLRGTRPNNHPIKRIESISGLLVDVFNEGITNVFYKRLKVFIKQGNDKALPSKNICKELVDPFITHNIGVERGLLILFNVILPFFYAYCGEEDIRKFLYTLYTTHPPIANNSITRFMITEVSSTYNGEFGNSSNNDYCKIIDTLRRQMGLIHLYKTLY